MMPVMCRHVNNRKPNIGKFYIFQNQLTFAPTFIYFGYEHANHIVSDTSFAVIHTRMDIVS